MSTLRINNIEAQSIPASPTIDEKVKVTNSSGDILVNIDGKTSGITTIGINTTDGNIKFDANSNVLITGILTATTLAGNFTPTSLEIGSNIKLGNAGVITATSFVGSGANLTSLPAQLTLSNNADNRVITGGSGTNLNGEANLTWDASALSIKGSGEGGPYIYRDQGQGPDIVLHGSRGTIASPTASAGTDILGNINFAGYDGSAYQRRASINGIIDGTVVDGSNTVPTAIKFETGTTSKTERLRIASGGQVIIGDNDTDKANGHFDDLIVGANASTTETHGITIVCGNAATNGGIAFSDGSNGGADAYRGMISYQHNDNHMQFRTNAVERLRITSGGILCTGNYSTVLDSTSGSIQINGDTSGGRLSFRGSSTSAYAGLGEMHGFWDTNKVASILFHAGSDTSNKDDGEIRMYTRPSGGSAAERLRITSDGYVQTPKNPYFRAYHNGNSDMNGVVIWNSTQNNNGSVYDTSTGVFTAPVAGFYWFAFTVKGRSVGQTVYARAEKSTNGGSSYSGIGPALEFHNDILSAHTTASFGEYLNASDKVRIGSGSNVRIDASNGFSGFLAG